MGRKKSAEPYGAATFTLGQSWINKLDNWCCLKGRNRRNVLEAALKHYFDSGVEYMDDDERKMFTHCPAFTFKDRLAAATTLAELPEMPDQDKEWPNYQLFVKKKAELYREESARKRAAEKAVKEAQSASSAPDGEYWL
jgi:hypothetical protein